jgi:hypothetical protein
VVRRHGGDPEGQIVWGLVQNWITKPSLRVVELGFAEMSVSPRLVELQRHRFHGGNRHVLSYARGRGFAAGNSQQLPR